MGEMRVMGVEGDLKSIWDPESEGEVEAMKKQFNELKKKGMVAYRVDKKGEKGSLMDEFDSDAGKIIFAPGMKGG
jgi:hypothetical protein